MSATSPRLSASSPLNACLPSGSGNTQVPSVLIIEYTHFPIRVRTADDPGGQLRFLDVAKLQGSTHIPTGRAGVAARECRGDPAQGITSPAVQR